MALTAYRTVRQEAQIEIVIERSRFIGYCFPVKGEEETLQKLEEIRKRHWDATHNCYAYSIGPRGDLARFSDDGEPGGTAGMPMMEVLRKKGVTDLLCVATRYFGGILLGAGGLVRAYGRTAAESIDAAGLVHMRPCVRYRVETDYARWGAVEGVLRGAGMVEDVAYQENVRAAVLVDELKAAAFEKTLVERTDGRVRPEALKSCYGAFPEE